MSLIFSEAGQQHKQTHLQYFAKRKSLRRAQKSLHICLTSQHFYCPLCLFVSVYSLYLSYGRCWSWQSGMVILSHPIVKEETIPANLWGSIILNTTEI